MEVLFDPVKRQRAEVYHRGRGLHDWAVRIFGILGVVIFFGFGWEFSLHDLFTAWTDSTFLQIVSFVGIILLVFWILRTFFEYFTTYRMRRIFGLSTQTPGGWLSDQLKGLILGILFGSLLSWGLLSLIEDHPGFWWAYAAFYASILHVLTVFLMPVVLLPLYYKLKSYPATSLRSRLERLFIRANVKVADIYEINYSSKTTSVNAAVMGLGKTRKIVLGDTMGNRYTDAEIEAVLAHEIGHYVHKDMVKKILLEMIGFLVTFFLTAQVWPGLVSWRGYTEPFSIAGLPLLFLIIGILRWAISPLEMWHSRHLERKADIYALNLIDQPRELAMAFVKLADDNLSQIRLDWYTLLFRASHPSIGERINRALVWKK